MYRPRSAPKRTCLASLRFQRGAIRAPSDRAGPRPRSRRGITCEPRDPRRLGKWLGRLAGGMAHDFNNRLPISRPAKRLVDLAQEIGGREGFGRKLGVEPGQNCGSKCGIKGQPRTGQSCGQVVTKIENGEGGIRTHGGVTPTPVFETGLFNRSSTSPVQDRVAWRPVPQTLLLLSPLLRGGKWPRGHAEGRQGSVAV